MWFFQQLLFDPRMCLLEWPDRCLQNPKELEAFQMIGRQVLLKQHKLFLRSSYILLPHHQLRHKSCLQRRPTQCLKSDGTCLYSDILSFVLAHRNFVSKTGCY